MSKKAFTTIELIIMITLLAIMLVLIVPNFITYLDNSSKAEYNTAKQSLENAAEAYIEDRGGFENYTGNVDINDLKTAGYIDQKTIDTITNYAGTGLAGAALSGNPSNYSKTICVDASSRKVEYTIDGNCI